MDAETAKVVASFDDCGFARTLGLRVIAVEDGAVTVSMEGKGEASTGAARYTAERSLGLPTMPSAARRTS